MELKSLILGLVLTLGIFALKSGIGMHYFLDQKKDIKIKWLFFLLFAIVYLLMFMVFAFILQHTAFIKYFDMMQNIIKSGMVIHVLMAGLLLVWGIFLLTGKEASSHTYGWLPLVVPCPVCMITIFFSTGLLIAFFPDMGYVAVLWAYKGFVLISLLTVLGMNIWKSRTGDTSETLLGGAMLLIAAYFFLAVIIMPQFGDLDKVYRLALYTGKDSADTTGVVQRMICYAMMIMIFSGGFLSMSLKIRRIQK